MNYILRYLMVIINVNSVYLVVVPQRFYLGSKYMYSTILCYMMQSSKASSLLLEMPEQRLAALLSALNVKASQCEAALVTSTHKT